MVDINDIDSLPTATELNLTDLMVKVNRGGGVPVLEKVEYQLIRSTLAGAPASPGIVKITQTVLGSSFTDGGGASGTLALSTQIPAGAIFIQSRVLVNVGFTGDTSAVLTIGDGSDVDRYNTGTPSVFDAGQIDVGNPSGAKDHVVDTTVTLTITSDTDFGSVVGTGSLTIDLYYIATV